MQGIYLIKNTVNNKGYVGSSKNIKNRLSRHHLFRLRHNAHWNPHLQSAWNTYGEAVFKFEVLEIVSETAELVSREQYWMDQLKVVNPSFGYNLAPKADRSEVSAETKKKILKSRGDKYKGVNSPMYGKKHSEKSKEKIRSYQLGRPKKPISQEHKQKLALRVRGKTYEEIYGVEKATKMKQILKEKLHEYHTRNKASHCCSAGFKHEKG